MIVRSRSRERSKGEAPMTAAPQPIYFRGYVGPGGWRCPCGKELPEGSLIHEHIAVCKECPR